ncbi:MAG TPA: DEAD/DEAH box helicase [Calditrichia bacterium]|nr:DEAD/DEAH box helicase [Calditrichia bacterium]
MKFERYDIDDQIKKNLAELGFKRPTDIQFKAIPDILKGEDVLAIAQTGTGKTAAFAIPVIDKIQRQKKNRRALGIKCLVMVPTRELAMQIGGGFNQLTRHTHVKSFAVFGGVEQDAQIQKLQAGIDVLVATPGRMFDLISQGFIDLKAVQTLVLDEADHMLGLGFIEDIKFVKKKLPHEHQTLFFSATINRDIKKLAYSQVRGNAIRIEIAPEDPVSKNVTHFVMYVKMDDKRFFLERFVRENPESKIMVFVRTRVRAERVAKAMARFDIEAETIHGEKDQKARTAVMQDFKEGEGQLLVATDVSARGIDIPDVNFVINYDLPDHPENYVHRVGRTGRGVKKGIAISYCAEEEKEKLARIQAILDKPIREIRIGKRDYAETVAAAEGIQSAEALIAEHERRQNSRKKGGKSSRKKSK